MLSPSSVCFFFKWFYMFTFMKGFVLTFNWQFIIARLWWKKLTQIILLFIRLYNRSIHVVYWRYFLSHFDLHWTLIHIITGNLLSVDDCHLLLGPSFDFYLHFRFYLFWFIDIGNRHHINWTYFICLSSFFELLCYFCLIFQLNILSRTESRVNIFFSAVIIRIVAF